MFELMGTDHFMLVIFLGGLNTLKHWLLLYLVYIFTILLRNIFQFLYIYIYMSLLIYFM